jgi:hypothetical protein
MSDEELSDRAHKLGYRLEVQTVEARDEGGPPVRQPGDDRYYLHPYDGSASVGPFTLDEVVAYLDGLDA